MPDPKKIDFIARRKNEPKEQVKEDYFEDFILDGDDADVSEFESLWAAAAYKPPEQKRHHASRPQNRNPQKPQDQDVKTSAPYRFIALNEMIAAPENAVLDAWRKAALHDRPLPGGVCGEITLKVIFDGPMLIGEKQGEEDAPLRLGSTPVIPGATLRGMTRATLEAVAFAKLTQTNLHRRFAVRDFNHALFRDDERNRIKTGWLTKAGTGARITPCDHYLIRIRDFAPDSRDPGEWHVDWLTEDLKRRYQKHHMQHGDLVNFRQTQRFTKGEGRDVAPAPDGSGEIEGVYVFSDGLKTLQGLINKDRDAFLEKLNAQDGRTEDGQHKKRECVFATEPSGDPADVPDQVWKNFELNNSTPSRHKPTPAGNWAMLKPTFDAAGQRIPVFYVEENGRIVDLGLTRVFKRAHELGVEDVLRATGGGCHILPEDPGDFAPDFVEALFGYVHEPDGDKKAYDDHDRMHLKGRVGFSFAMAEPGCWKPEAARVSGVLSAPRPSFAPHYLGSAANKDWSDASARLAGRKRYVPRNARTGADLQRWFDVQPEQGTEKTRSRMRFLEASENQSLTFTAAVRVHNITETEMGGLLWALTFGGDANKRHMIGRAKMAGAGQARIEVTTINLERNEGGAPPDFRNSLRCFEEHMAQQAPGWAQSAPLSECLALATPGYKDANELSYLALRRHRDIQQAYYDANGGKEAANRRQPRLLNTRS